MKCWNMARVLDIQ